MLAKGSDNDVCKCIDKMMKGGFNWRGLLEVENEKLNGIKRMSLKSLVEKSNEEV